VNTVQCCRRKKYEREIEKLLERGVFLEDLTPKEGEEKGRRTIMWRVFRDLNDSTVDRFMTKIGELQTAFWLRYRTSYNIKLVETGKVVLWHSKLEEIKG